MTTFLIFQAATVLFAIASAYEESAFTYPFRKNDPWIGMAWQLKSAHRAGAVGVGMILLGFAGSEAIIHGLFTGLLTFICCGLWYWFVFDIAYAVRIKQGPFYLGNSAGTDNKLKKLLGKNAGLIKAVFCLVGIIAINLTFKHFVNVLLLQ